MGTKDPVTNLTKTLTELWKKGADGEGDADAEGEDDVDAGADRAPGSVIPRRPGTRGAVRAVVPGVVKQVKGLVGEVRTHHPHFRGWKHRFITLGCANLTLAGM